MARQTRRPRTALKTRSRISLPDRGLRGPASPASSRDERRWASLLIAGVVGYAIGRYIGRRPLLRVLRRFWAEETGAHNAAVIQYALDAVADDDGFLAAQRRMAGLQ